MRPLTTLAALITLVLLTGGCPGSSRRQAASYEVETVEATEPAQNPSYGIDKNDNPRSILLSSGEYVGKWVDMLIRGRRLGFVFRRSWRSMSDRVTPLGAGWDANVFQSLEFLAGGTIRHHDGTGRFDDYDGGIALGRFAVLRDNGDSTFTLRYRDGMKCHFDDTGRLTAEEDRIGNRREYAYDELGRLVTATDDLGREIDFAYDASDRLATITDFAGREVRYAYDPLGRLIDVRTPLVTGTPNGNDFPNGKTRSYQYDAAGSLSAIVYPNENADGSETPTQTMLYDALSRVIETTVGGTNANGVAAGGTLTYQYNGLLTTVTDRNGNVTTYEHNALGQATRVDDNGFVTTFTYDGEGNRTSVTYPEGNSVQYVYDSAGPDRFRQGNLLSVTRLPGARSGSQTEIRTTYTYDPLYNQVSSSTSPRGNDGSYVPQNGGTRSAERYTTRFFYDYQENPAAPAEAATWNIDLSGFLNMGDLNGDGATDGFVGNLIRRDAPTVTLSPGSKQAAEDGDSLQEVIRRYRYNEFGQLVAEEDPRGNVTTYEYFPEEDPDGDGNDITAGRNANTGGYLFRITVDADTGGSDPFPGTSRQDAATPVHIVSTYTYDGRGNRTSQTDGRGLVTRWIYNEQDQVVQIEAPKVDEGQSTGYLRRFHYDANDNLVRVDVEDVKTDPETHLPTAGGEYFTHLYLYDILDRLIEKRMDATRDDALPASDEPETLVTQYRYDGNENRILVTRPEGNRTTHLYDERDLLTRTVRGDGSPEAATTTYAYDGNMNRTSTIDSVDADQQRHVYDGFDRLTAVFDREDNETLLTYDPDGNRVRLEVIGPPNGTEVVDVLLTATDFLYDELNREFRVDRELFVPIAPSSNATVVDGSLTPGDGKVSTVFEFDSNSRRTFLLRDDEACFRTEYDGADRVIREVSPIEGTEVRFEYDENGNVVEVNETHTSPEAIESPKEVQRILEYDALDRIVRETDNLGQSIYREYDSRDNVIAEFDARGAVPNGTNDPGNGVFRRYDGVSRRWAVVHELRVDGEGDMPLDPGAFNADGLITKITEYDGNGNVVRRVDDEGNVTAYEYDNLDRRVVRTNADGGERVWTFDDDDRVTQVVDENGTVIVQRYDALDRLTSREITTNKSFLTGTTEQKFEYDGLSRLTLSTDNNDPADVSDDSSVVSRYDSLGRLVEQVQNGHAVGHSYAGDDRVGCEYPSGRVVTFAWDLLNQPIQTSTDLIDVATFYQGACRNNILRRWLVDGETIAERKQDLDLIKLPEQIEFFDPNSNSLGMINVARNRSNSVAAASLLFQDPRGGGFPPVQPAMPLDSRGRIALQDDGQATGELGSIGGIVTEFEYDGAGNVRRTTKTGNIVETFLFDDVHQRNDLVFDGGNPGAGLRTEDDLHVFQWDGLGRLRAVRLASDDSLVESYTYDAEPGIVSGRRISTDSALTGETRFYYDGSRVIEEMDGAEGVTAEFVFNPGIDDPVLLFTGGQSFCYMTDWNRNVTHLIDGNGQPVEFYLYDQNGNPTVLDQVRQPLPESQVGNPLLFTGQRFDFDTSLYWFGSRFYDPAIGEYLSRHPYGIWGDESADGNPLVYAGNDPWNVREPLGLGPMIPQPTGFVGGLPPVQGPLVNPAPPPAPAAPPAPPQASAAPRGGVGYVRGTTPAGPKNAIRYDFEGIDGGRANSPDVFLLGEDPADAKGMFDDFVLPEPCSPFEPCPSFPPLPFLGLEPPVIPLGPDDVPHVEEFRLEPVLPPSPGPKQWVWGAGLIGGSGLGNTTQDPAPVQPPPRPIDPGDGFFFDQPTQGFDFTETKPYAWP